MVEVGDGRLTIQSEGKVRKFVERVDEITYPLLSNVAERMQKAKIVTERAVFAVKPDGLVLTELATSINAKPQVIHLMDCPPYRVPEPLPRMADRLFRD